jgi:hypothetical protein
MLPKLQTVAMLATMWLFTAVRPAAADELPTYTIRRAAMPIVVDGRLDEPAWLAAPDVGRFQFPWWTSGKQEQTLARLLYDDHNLYVAYLCQDAHISAEHKERDSAVYRDDCVEIFVAPDPDRPAAYINIEMNAAGAFLDQFRTGVAGEPVQGDWNAKGVRIATKIAGTLNDDSDEDQHWVLEAAIPLDNFAMLAKQTPPQPADRWRVGLNRCGGNTNPQYSQWSSSNTPKPAFHVPERFGTVIFSDRTSPF